MKIFLYLRDDNEEEDDEFKALVDSGTDRLIEIDDTLADENYALDKGLNFFLPTFVTVKPLNTHIP